MQAFLQHIVDKVTGKIPLDAPRRSSGWAKVEKEHLVSFPVCAVCETKDGLNVHHIKPFHLFPALELEPTNLITLCRAHHELFGHLDEWKSYNVNVIDDAKTWNDKIKKRP